MKNRIAVVDEANRFLRWEDRRTIHQHHLPHRSVHVLVFNAAGQLYVQRRHREKLTFPRFWDNSVAGHVEESDYPAGPDESLDRVYHEVASRELHEELGIQAPLEELGAFSPHPGIHYEHFRLYRTRHEGPFVLQPEEVEDGRWFDRETLLAMKTRQEEPVTPLLLFLVEWLGERRLWG
jgi:isopentenyldiphosphate isomerase